MDYGNRQERAEMLVKAFRTQGEKTFPWRGRMFTGAELALEIEGMTEFGQSLVAVAGLVLQAMAATPEFFEKKAAG